MFIVKDNCPMCAVQGKMWRSKPEVFECPSCNALFSEFGLVIEGYRSEIQVT